MVTNRDDVSIAIRSAFLKKETKQKINLTIYPEIDTVKKNLKKNGFLKIPKLVQGDTKTTLKIKKNLPKKVF